jgi:large subunit ribosomal protein L32e
MSTEKTDKKPSPSRAALKLRARAKNKKPAFIRAESWKYDRFSLSWRKPRGLDNKIRRKIKGWPPGPSVGYKGPKIARGLHPSGYREVMVYNTALLSTIDPNTQALRIAHTVGKRKRAMIIAEAKKLNLKILNVKISKKTEAEEGEETESEEAEQKDETEAAEEETIKEEKKRPKAEKKKKAPKKAKTKSKKGEEKQ